MSIEVEVGTKAIVTVPASTANLGPGYDTLGMALSLYDTVEVEVTTSGLVVEIFGEGAEDLPRDGSHLVVKAIRSALSAADATVPGLRVVSHNNIPQSRGLGSSASAAVAGVAAGNALAGSPLTQEQVVQLSSAFEGHPDNAAASVLGDAVVSWTNVPVDGHSLPDYRAASIKVHEDIRATALVPDFHASTQAVRRVLPSHVTHSDAAFNVSRTAVRGGVAKLPGSPVGGNPRSPASAVPRGCASSDRGVGEPPAQSRLCGLPIRRRPHRHGAAHRGY